MSGARGAIGVIGAVMFVSFIGIGMIVPLFPLFGERVGAPAEAITALLAIVAVGQLVSTPFWGWVSDRLGRKPVFLLSLLGAAVANVMLAYADSLAMLAMSRVVAGLMAGVGAVAFAAVADVTDEQSRARAMGWVGAAFSLGFILGPALGGLLAGSDAATADYRMVGLVAAALDLLAAILALLFIRESRPAGAAAHRPPVGALALTLRDPVLLRLGLAGLLFNGSFAVIDSTLPLFASRQHGFSPLDIGYTFTLMGAVTTAMQALVIGRLTERAGPFSTVLTGLALMFAGQCLVALSPTPWVMVAGLLTLAAALGAFMAPSSSIVAAAAHEAERGALLGVFQGAGNLGRAITPLFSGALFAGAGMPAPFLAGALLVLPAIACVIGARRHAAR